MIIMYVISSFFFRTVVFVEKRVHLWDVLGVIGRDMYHVQWSITFCFSSSMSSSKKIEDKKI